MPNVADGIPYEYWERDHKSLDAITKASSEHVMVKLYDGLGRAQLVRGSAVQGQLAKRGASDQPIFFAENPNAGS